MFDVPASTGLPEVSSKMFSVDFWLFYTIFVHHFGTETNYRVVLCVASLFWVEARETPDRRSQNGAFQYHGGTLSNQRWSLFKKCFLWFSVQMGDHVTVFNAWAWIRQKLSQHKVVVTARQIFGSRTLFSRSYKDWTRDWKGLPSGDFNLRFQESLFAVWQAFVLELGGDAAIMKELKA